MEPAVDVHHLAGDARGRGPRAGTRSRRPTGVGVRVVPAERGAARSSASASASNPGIPLPAIVRSGPAETVFTRTPCGPRSRARYRVTDFERRLRDAHPVVDRPRDAGVEVERGDRPALLAHEGQQPLCDRLQRERAHLQGRADALPRACCRKLPPSASCGANAIACRKPSTRPHRRSRAPRRAPRSCSGSLASISSTSGGCGQALGASSR